MGDELLIFFLLTGVVILWAAFYLMRKYPSYDGEVTVLEGSDGVEQFFVNMKPDELRGRKSVLLKIVDPQPKQGL